jgi:hypothetical protein
MFQPRLSAHESEHLVTVLVFNARGGPLAMLVQSSKVGTNFSGLGFDSARSSASVLVVETFLEVARFDRL